MSKWGPTLLCLGFAVAFAGGAWAQEEEQAQVPYCNITDVQVRVLSNAVRLTVVADGTIEWDYYPARSAYYDYDPKRDTYSARPLRRFSVLFPNARNRLGWSVKDVSRYPVSHLEVSIPPESTTGLGVVITLEVFDPMSYREARPQMSRDRRRAIFTLMSDRHYEPEKERPPRGPGELRFEVRSGGLSLHAVNVDMRSLAATLSQKCLTPVTVDDAVDRLVTAHLDRRDLGDLLRALCDAYGLTLSAQDRGYYITEPFAPRAGAPPSPAAYATTPLQRLPLAHLNARQARSLLPDCVWPYVRPDEESNALILSGTEGLARKMAEDLRRLDQPGPTVEVAVEIIEFVDREAREFAFSPVWGAGGQEQRWEPATGTITVETGLLSGKRLALRLRALERRERARLLTRAVLRLRNGQSGELFFGQEQFIVVQNPYTRRARPAPVDIGLRLGVTAWTSGKEVASVTLSARLTTVVGRDPITRLPELGVRQIQAQLLTPLGQPVALGGFTLKREDSLTTQVGVLSEAPLIGGLFRESIWQKSHNEVVVLVTPRLAGGGSDLGPSNQRKILEEGVLQ